MTLVSIRTSSTRDIESISHFRSECPKVIITLRAKMRALSGFAHTPYIRSLGYRPRSLAYDLDTLHTATVVAVVHLGQEGRSNRAEVVADSPGPVLTVSKTFV